MVYIEYIQDGEKIRRGPYWSVSPDGTGAVIGQSWTTYQVQEQNGRFHRIVIPTKYHTLTIRSA